MRTTVIAVTTSAAQVMPIGPRTLLSLIFIVGGLTLGRHALETLLRKETT